MGLFLLIFKERGCQKKGKRKQRGRKSKEVGTRRVVWPVGQARRMHRTPKPKLLLKNMKSTFIL